MGGNRTIFRIMAHEVDTVVEPSDLREICQIMEDVVVDLIKVQTLADLESQARQFQEMLLDVIIVRNQGTYLDFVKDEKMMKID